MKLPFDMLVY